MTLSIEGSSSSPSSNNNKNIKSRPKRAFASHTPKWQRFQTALMIPSEKAANLVSKQATEVYAYQRQYSHVYDHRLLSLKPRCWESMKSKDHQRWTKVNRVLELREDVPSMVVGTLVKETTAENADKNKDSSVLHENSKCRATDQLFLEDASGRVALEVLGQNVHQYCTGVVMGVTGTVDKKGILQAESIFPPAPALHPKTNGVYVPSDGNASVPPHLLLVSGLLCGDPNVPPLPRDMLLSYLQGHFTDDAQKVCRLIVAGGGPSSQDPLEGVRELDAWGLQLCAMGVPVDLIPAQSDPTTANWPQRPLHSSLFPNSSSTGLWFRTPNPYAAVHGERYVLGTDGRNIHDMCQFILHQTENQESNSDDSDGNNGGKVSPPSELDALRHSLEWGHICPTGPDSVPTVPHVDSDPMVLEQTPHIYFCGNTSEFATELVDGDSGTSTRLICVPKFSERGEAVLVNLETLAVELLRFDTN